MEKENSINIDLTSDDLNEEVIMAAVEDADLLKIKCYAVHEGKNGNGLIMLREVLLNSYRTLIDKPVVIEPDKNDFPLKHGYDYKTKQFNHDKRKTIGHVVDAYPVIVKQDGTVVNVYDIEDTNEVAGELRIVTQLVVYKQYYPNIVERIKFLHNVDNLSFSIEAITRVINADDNTRVASQAGFTALAIVDVPAFEHSKSIEVAAKEDNGMEELQAKFEQALADKVALETNVANLETELASVKDENVSLKEELANTKVEVASLQTEKENIVAELTPYKEKVELAAKEALGKERAAKLSKLGVEKDATELASMSKEDFADLVLNTVENASVNIENASYTGFNFENIGLKNESSLDELKAAIDELNK